MKQRSGVGDLCGTEWGWLPHICCEGWGGKIRNAIHSKKCVGFVLGFLFPELPSGYSIYIETCWSSPIVCF